MRYKNFDIEDFVNDHKFQEWVLNPNPEINYFWEKWLLQNPEKEIIIHQATEIVRTLGLKKQASRERTKRKLWEKINESNVTLDQQKSTVSKGKVQPMYASNSDKTYQRVKQHRKVYMAIAACVTFLLLAVGFQYFHSKSIDRQTVHLVTKSNPPGQKSELRLPDGSMVYMNAASKVSYVENFQTEKREIFLEGEAFFEVKTDKSRPFTVVTGSLTTTAVGTSFNIQAYKDESQISVGLVTGKVMIDDLALTKSLMLAPGEGVILEKKTGKITRREIDVEETLFWKNRTIYFENTDFNNAIQSLERWYGVSITLTGSPQKQLTCSGRFENESLENVLKALGFALNFEYEIINKQVKLMFKSN